ncbi:hypothetical protein [Sphingomonas daechungensis]|uniref:hypothetical protein n=1 Tax=Sphingomonas daechungensis TaxID=1176646 RepID=UPI0037837C82
MTAHKFISPRVGERGRSPRGGVSRAFRPRFAAAAAAALALTACAATQDGAAVASGSPGFLLGLWHGFIFPVAWVFSLFFSKIAVYAVPNNGGWYDFGYFLGIVVFGVGARKGQVVYRDRNVIDVKAKRVEDIG